MMDDKTNARLVEALRRRKVARFPAVEVEGRMPRPMVDTPPVITQPGYGLERSAEGLPPLVREIRTVRPGEDDLGRPVAPPVAAPVVAPPPVEDDSELEAVREADRQSRFAAGMELAGRQLVGGITRTPVPQGLGANPSEVPLAMARAKSKREQAAELLRAQRQGRMDESTLALQASQTERNLREPGDVPMTPAQAANIELRTKDQELRHAADERKRIEAERKAAAAAAAIRAKAAEKAKTEGIAAESAKIPFKRGRFVPLPGTKPNPTVATQSITDVKLYSAADSAIESLNGALAAWAKSPSAATKDDVTAKVRGASVALNAAYKQGAMQGDEAAAMKAALGADLASVAGIEAVLSNLMGNDAKTSADTITRRAKAVQQQLDGMARASMKAANYAYEADPEPTKMVKGVPHEKRADGLWYPVGGK